MELLSVFLVKTLIINLNYEITFIKEQISLNEPICSLK